MVRVLRVRPWLVIAVLFAFQAGLGLALVGDVYACSPRRGDDWFTLLPSLLTSTLPSGFSISEGRVVRKGKRQCVRADAQPLEGYMASDLERFAKSKRSGDGRPTDVRIPAADAMNVVVYCDQTDHINTEGRVSYIPAGSVGTLHRHVELDMRKVAHLVRAWPDRHGAASGDLQMLQRGALNKFCTITSERIIAPLEWHSTPPHVPGSDPPKYSWRLGTRSLGAIIGTQEAESGYPEVARADSAPEAKKFKVSVDCFRSKVTIKAIIEYALSRSYDPNQHARSVEACDEYENPRPRRRAVPQPD